MRIAYTMLILVILLATGCQPLAPQPTPTPVPEQLPDPGMQQAAMNAVESYAKSVGYAYHTPSLTIVSAEETKALVHASVSFQTRKGFPYEEYDALINLRKTGSTWHADPVQEFTKLDWEKDLQRGPATLRSAAGFTVQVPAGWSGFAAPESELIPLSQCGVGFEPIKAVPLLAVMPTGYSAANVPVILRAFQQCPRAQGLGIIRQRLENVRDSDKTLKFERLELIDFAGTSALLAVVSDENGSVLYDVYVLYRERQLEFAVQAHAGQDLTKVLEVLNTMRFG